MKPIELHDQRLIISVVFFHPFVRLPQQTGCLLFYVLGRADLLKITLPSAGSKKTHGRPRLHGRLSDLSDET